MYIDALRFSKPKTAASSTGPNNQIPVPVPVPVPVFHNAPPDPPSQNLNLNQNRIHPRAVYPPRRAHLHLGPSGSICGKVFVFCVQSPSEFPGRTWEISKSQSHEGEGGCPLASPSPRPTPPPTRVPASIWRPSPNPTFSIALPPALPSQPPSQNLSLNQNRTTPHLLLGQSRPVWIYLGRSVANSSLFCGLYLLLNGNGSFARPSAHALNRGHTTSCSRIFTQAATGIAIRSP